MTGGRGVIIRRPSVAESLRVLLGRSRLRRSHGRGGDGPLFGCLRAALHLHPTHAEAFYVLSGDAS